LRVGSKNVTETTTGGSSSRIRELEREFRHDGLPNLIVRRSGSQDLLARALPFLMLVFVAEIVIGFDEEGGWTNLLLGLGAIALLVGALGVLNAVRGHRLFSLPHGPGRGELVAFAVLPAVVPVVVDGRVQVGVGTMVLNVTILALAYVVVGIGLISIMRWAVTRLFVHLGTSLTALVRAMPLLLFFSLISFFTAEIWEVFTAPSPATYWAAISLFVLLGMVFLSVRLPSVVRELQAESYMGDVPLRRPERLNLAVVSLVSESLQVLFVSGAVWIFYVVLGTLLVSADVRAAWLDQPDTIIWRIALFGEQLDVTWQLLRVATGVAAFTGLYYTVTILLDSAYREQFIHALSKGLRGSFERRSEYLELLRQQGASVMAEDPTAAR
jgi:hypothetical protein